jgi:hypothetical protein
MATKVGRELLWKIMHYDQVPAPDHLTVCMPKVAHHQFIWLLVEVSYCQSLRTKAACSEPNVFSEFYRRYSASRPTRSRIPILPHAGPVVAEQSRLLRRQARTLGGHRWMPTPHNACEITSSRHRILRVHARVELFAGLVLRRLRFFLVSQYCPVYFEASVMNNVTSLQQCS